MNAQVERSFEIAILSALMFAPLAIWLVLHTVDTLGMLRLEPTMAWLKALGWITYVCGAALFLATFTSTYFARDIKYAGALLTFSAGLSMPLGWLRRKSSRVEARPSLDVRPLSAVTKTEGQ